LADLADAPKSALGEADAIARHSADPLPVLRERFLLPVRADGSPSIYNTYHEAWRFADLLRQVVAQV
jgi:hypothetical protein